MDVTIADVDSSVDVSDIEGDIEEYSLVDETVLDDDSVEVAIVSDVIELLLD